MFINAVDESLVNFREDHDTFALLLIWDNIVVHYLLVKLEKLSQPRDTSEKIEYQTYLSHNLRATPSICNHILDNLCDGLIN